MFLSFALFETLDADGRVESFLVFPTDSPTVPVDRLRDIRGMANVQEVDLGPLRFYADEGGLKIRRITSMLGHPSFSRRKDALFIDIAHSGLPIASNTTGYYSLLLPPNYYGECDVSLHHSSEWIQDSRRLLLSIELYDHEHYEVVRSVYVRSRLERGVEPPPSVVRTHSKDVYSSWTIGPNHSTVRNFIRAANATLSDNAPSVFLCHSSTDKKFARKLAVSLASKGTKVWIDEAEIGIGDSLIDKIEEGIYGSKHLIAILSSNSVNSQWCREELKMAMVRQINAKGITVLPVLVDECELPGFLQEKKYADFTIPRLFDQSLQELCSALDRHEGLEYRPPPLPIRTPNRHETLCPYCGKPLASPRARICLHCSKKWFHLEPGQFPSPTEGE